MIRLLKIDFRKYFYNRSFWVLFLIYVLLNLLVFTGAEKFVNEIVQNAGSSTPLEIPGFSLYSFPLVWHNLSYLGGFFKIVLALIVIIFITNEFSYKTIRQNIMNGMGREQFLFSKVIFVFVLSFAATLLMFVTGLFLGYAHTNEVSFALFIQKIGFIPAYFLELFTFSSLALLVGFLLRKTGLSIALLALYYYAFEPILSYRLPENIAAYLPLKSMGNLIDVPNSSLMKMFGVNFREFVSMPDVYLCSLYSMVFIGIVYLILRNKDL